MRDVIAGGDNARQAGAVVSDRRETIPTAARRRVTAARPRREANCDDEIAFVAYVAATARAFGVTRPVVYDILTKAEWQSRGSLQGGL